MCVHSSATQPASIEVVETSEYLDVDRLTLNTKLEVVPLRAIAML